MMLATRTGQPLPGDLLGWSNLRNEKRSIDLYVMVGMADEVIRLSVYADGELRLERGALSIDRWCEFIQRGDECSHD